MQNQKRYILILIVLLQTAYCLAAVESGKAAPFAGQDLYLTGAELTSYQPETGKHILIFPADFSITIGANKYSADSAVVWLESKVTKYHGRSRIDYNAQIYLKGSVETKKGKSARTTGLTQIDIVAGEATLIAFGLSGEVFITAEARNTSDPRNLPIYREGIEAIRSLQPQIYVIKPEARVPDYYQPYEIEPAQRQQPGFAEETIQPITTAELPPVKAAPAQQETPSFQYPIDIAPAGEDKLRFETTKADDGSMITTIIGRFYLSQKIEEQGRVLELQADSAVIFHAGENTPIEPQAKTADELPESPVRAIYLTGNVLMTEGSRTIRAEEIYYDFQKRNGLVVDAVIRTFDTSRDIPVYVRAKKLRQLAQDQFAAEDVTITTSEFHLPQISLQVAHMSLTNTPVLDDTGTSKANFDAQMQDVCLKYEENTLLHLPKLRSGLERPDLPIRSLSTSFDNTWGLAFETKWYLSRLLGLRETEGVENSLSLDYFSKRGPGAGLDIDYAKEDHYGELFGYIIHDEGEDDLGRDRDGIPPDQKLRGRFGFRHRQFLPYKWQLTTELSYLSDRNFLESYYRSEFNAGKEQETLLHLKRIEDNWGFATLAKGRINDFQDQLEELPSAEFHWTGQSLFNDMFTLYSDSTVGRFRQRLDNDNPRAVNTDFFTFGFSRAELDMPMRMDNFKLVPYVAGTVGYDDRSGFQTGLVNGTGTGTFGDKTVFTGELGIRLSTQYWKRYPEIKSRLWDLNQLRHIIKPQVTAALYDESDSVVAQRDTVNFTISQRLQTKRGLGDKTRTVDWMRLNTGFTWVNDSEDSSTPDQFLWNRPIAPLGSLSAPSFFNADLGAAFRTFEIFGPRRNNFTTDYTWRLTDTTAFLTDAYYDMQSGVFQQVNAGFTHLAWPDLSYYIGSRYLRGIEVEEEKGSNALVFAATYVLDPRYTVTLAQQYDFDYGHLIRSDITLIRKYHRMFCGLTFSSDQSLDRQAIVFSIWPEGVPELSLGPRRYMGLRAKED